MVIEGLVQDLMCQVFRVLAYILLTYYIHILLTKSSNIFMGWILVSYTFTIWEADV